MLENVVGVGKSALAMAGGVPGIARYGAYGAAGLMGYSALRTTWNAGTDPYDSGPGRFLHGGLTGAISGAKVGFMGTAGVGIASRLAQPGGLHAAGAAFTEARSSILGGVLGGTRDAERGMAHLAAYGEMLGAAGHGTVGWAATQASKLKMVGKVTPEIGGAINVGAHFGEELARGMKGVKWGGGIGLGIGLGAALVGTIAAHHGGPQVDSNRSVY